MAKSMVERYAQVLAQDPTSTVFVELARALLDAGDPARAVEVCAQGLTHHPTSVVGRVLWGKALIVQGRPAEAMSQFDQAIAIDRDNPHAYNLIGETLLQRGLYRSALPILRKAVALQPEDGRVRLWLEQTQGALAGGPAPVFADLHSVTRAQDAAGAHDPDAPATDASTHAPDAVSASSARPSSTAEAPAAGNAKSSGLRAQTAPRAGREEPASSAVGTSAAGEAIALPGPAGRTHSAGPDAIALPGPAATATSAAGDANALPSPAAAGGRAGKPELPSEDVDLSTPAQGTPVHEAPRAAAPREAGLPQVVRRARPERSRGAPPVLVSAEGGPPVLQPVEAPPSAGAPPVLQPVDSSPGSNDFAPPVLQALDGGLQGVSEHAASAPEGNAGEPALDVALPSWADPQEAAAPVAGGDGGGLLGELLPPPPEPLPEPVPAPARSKRSLLEDLPELAPPAAPELAASAPTATTPTRAAEIAQAYERELREKLAQQEARPSLLRRHGPKLALALVALVVLGVGAGVFFTRRAAQGGQTLGETLDLAERALGEDTPASLERALTLLSRAHEMDPESTRAWGLSAHAHALRFSEQGQSPEERRLALEALAHPGVRAEQPALALVTDLRVADDAARPAARAALLGSSLENAEVHALAGQLALREHDAKAAVGHFQRALALQPRHVRALVALGGYYLEYGDLPNALKVYETARSASPQHPAVRVGSAEARIALGQELPQALADMEALGRELAREKGAGLPEGLRERQVLAQARLLSALGRHPEARSLLAAQAEGPRSFEVQLALGQVARVAGDLPAAQRAFEAALALRADNEEALEGLGRTLVDRDRERDALARLGEAPGRKVALVRGAAYTRLGDWKRARAELARTRVSDRYPTEAVVYLALADAAAGNAEQARSVLERTLASVRSARGPVQVALGKVYWQLGQRDRARSQFESASKDPLDAEGACALGRLLLSLGLPDLALEPLNQAVARNGYHGEARDALGRTLLALGRGPEALKQYEAWQLDNPGDARGQKGFALALLQAGRVAEADAASARAVKLSPADPEAQRLRAVLAFRAGDAKAGFAALERANKLDPHSAPTFCEIGHAFLRQGNAGGAQKAFEAARREEPESACGQVGAYWSELPEGGGKPAVRALQQLAGKAPSAADRAFAQAALARVLLATGAPKEARAAAEEAVKLDPQSGRAQLALGLVLLRQRQEEAGRTALQRAAELEPADGLVRLALAESLERTDPGRALAEYEAFLERAGAAPEAARVKKLVPTLKRRLVAVGQ
ncbi:tetratricopeptide repeat protein [Aggregicoccus sp. 17bor-14]|uniref:tetratricopeptide repeat protein n=1 Tax=Myxococcaceae TaxID=31 RepID=UPI00129C3812|nr:MULTISPECIES: tetratricopeptide repeat protein [Myxococcaceae]MBF5042846.1 tetratricopeptide repeat protein [Simulacricoccus sp. 17bor-14]MRI88613.1 tetratricopeptide repeat protein [Aggregicoccus sp. 17bor-14]